MNPPLSDIDITSHLPGPNGRLATAGNGSDVSGGGTGRVSFYEGLGTLYKHITAYCDNGRDADGVLKVSYKDMVDVLNTSAQRCANGTFFTVNSLKNILTKKSYITPSEAEIFGHFFLRAPGDFLKGIVGAVLEKGEEAPDGSGVRGTLIDLGRGRPKAHRR